MQKLNSNGKLKYQNSKSHRRDGITRKRISCSAAGNFPNGQNHAPSQKAAPPEQICEKQTAAEGHGKKRKGAKTLTIKVLTP